MPAPQLLSTTGTTVVSGAGKDRSSNPSPAVSGSYKVDASAPVATAATGSYQPGSWTRSDAGGPLGLDTARPGTYTASRAVSDRAGHTTTLSCTYRVDAPAEPSATPTAEPSVEPTATPPPASTPPPAATSTPPASPATPSPARTRATPTTSTPTRTYPPPAAPVLTVEPRRPAVRNGRLRLTVACSVADCDGRLRLTGSRSRRFALLAGERRRITLRLLRRERRALAARGRLVLRVRLALAGAPARRLTVRARSA